MNLLSTAPVPAATETRTLDIKGVTCAFSLFSARLRRTPGGHRAGAVLVPEKATVDFVPGQITPVGPKAAGKQAGRVGANGGVYLQRGSLLIV